MYKLEKYNWILYKLDKVPGRSCFGSVKNRNVKEDIMIISNGINTNVDATANAQRMATESKNVQALNAKMAATQTAKSSSTAGSESLGVVLNLSGALSTSMNRAATTYSSSTTLKLGSQGSAVRVLQTKLTELGYNTKGTDGIFGNNTRNAVIEFQRAYGLEADGIVGNATRNQINTCYTNHLNNVLSVGSRGSNVKKLQENLTKLGYNTYGADGIFGNNTKKAVLSFQRANNLSADGIVGANTHKAINAALERLKNKPVDNPVDIDTSDLTAKQTKMIENLKNDTSLGLTSTKKTAMLTAAERLLSEGYEVEFVAGVLGNIQAEGSPGIFESSNYANPNNRPSYLKYMDNNFNYRSEFSGKTISQVGINKAVALQEKVENCGFAGKFGLGMIQWTGSRTTGLLEAYEKYCSSNYPTVEECAKAEANYIVDELQGSHSYVYSSWKKGNMTAQSAGEIVCRQYEVPANIDYQARTRGQNANAIYNVMMK